MADIVAEACAPSKGETWPPSCFFVPDGGAVGYAGAILNAIFYKRE